MTRGAAGDSSDRITSGAALRPPVRVSLACFAIAGVAFCAAWGMTIVAAGDLTEFFYEPRVLAVVHTFTLAWISLTMVGVLYQFVPALTKQPVFWPRAVGVQVGLFALGALGIITHFWTGTPRGVEWSAWIAVAGVLLFGAQLLPPLLRAPRRDATVIGLIAAVLSLLGTALLGLLYAVDKVHAFLPGSVLSNIAAHAHLGLLGWVTVGICAVSYRLVAAFLLPEIPLPHAARRQILLLITAIPVLVAALLLRSPWAIAPALVIAAALAWYALIIARLVRRRRMPIDWSIRHVGAALVFLAGAVAAALALFVVDPGDVLGSRLVLVYGLCLLVGWISNYIVGIGVRLIPGLIGWGSAPLLSEARRTLVFWLLNGGTLAAALALLAGSAAVLRIAALLPLAAGLLLAAALIGRVRAGRPARG